MAVNELERRRNQLEEYQIKARFALAESYDRATKKQQKKEEEEILLKNQQEKLLHQSESSNVIEPQQISDEPQQVNQGVEGGIK